jgi:cobalt-zinc-cadmium efflux system membrane fusion protein
MKKSTYLLFLAAALAACGNKAPKTAQTAADSSSVDTAGIEMADTTTTALDTMKVDGTTAATAKPNEVLFNGTIVLSPQRHATVAMTMGGVVKRTSLLPGQYVRKGQTVAVIENPEFISLQQNFLESYAQIEYLKKEYDRQRTLSTQQASPQKKAQSSKADYMSMKSKLDASSAQLRLLGISPARLLHSGIEMYLPVKAPISGFVSNLKINIGKYVNAGDDMCEIVDKSNPLICLTAYEKDLAKLRNGLSLEFRANGLGMRTFRAQIISVGENIDKVSRSLEVYARVLTPNVKFRPGMYVTARYTK